MYFCFQNLKIYYKRKITGNKPIVLLHGFGANSDAVDCLFFFLSKCGADVVSIDLPGFGKSSCPPKDFTVYDYAKSVTALCGFVFNGQTNCKRDETNYCAIGQDDKKHVARNQANDNCEDKADKANGNNKTNDSIGKDKVDKANGNNDGNSENTDKANGNSKDKADVIYGSNKEKTEINKPIVIGHSMGGRIAMIMAKNGAVDKLVLIDSAGIKPKFSLGRQLKIRLYKMRKRRLAQLESRIKTNGNDSEKLKSKYGKLNAKIKNSGSKDYLSLNANMRSVFVSVVNDCLDEVAKKITVKTLILWGKSDKETPVYMAKRLHRYIFCSKIEYLNGGHFAYATDKENCCRYIEQFIYE